MHFLLFATLNLALLSTQFEDLLTYINSIIYSFNKISVLSEIVVIFILIYLINELIAFTNLSNSLEKYILKRSTRTQNVLKLIISAFSTNINITDISFFEDEEFYHQGFLMSTLNIFSILMLELLFLLVFINGQYFKIWQTFIVLNFFVFIWLGKKLIDIFFNKEIKVLPQQNISNFSRVRKSKNSVVKYNSKYNIRKKNIVITILSNLIIIEFSILFFHTKVLLNLLIFLFAIFMELYIYIIFLIYKTQFIEEGELYKKIKVSLEYIFKHILLLFFSFIILKTIELLYDGFNIIELNISNFTIFVFLICLIILVMRHYLLLFLVILPFILSVFAIDIKVISFVISLSIYLFYTKNINFKNNLLKITSEVVIVLFGGVVSFLTLFYTNYFLALLIMVIYLFIIYFINYWKSGENVKN